MLTKMYIICWILDLLIVKVLAVAACFYIICRISIFTIIMVMLTKMYIICWIPELLIVKVLAVAACFYITCRINVFHCNHGNAD